VVKFKSSKIKARQADLYEWTCTGGH